MVVKFTSMVANQSKEEREEIIYIENYFACSIWPKFGRKVYTLTLEKDL